MNKKRPVLLASSIVLSLACSVSFAANIPVGWGIPQPVNQFKENDVLIFPAFAPSKNTTWTVSCFTIGGANAVLSGIMRVIPAESDKEHHEFEFDIAHYPGASTPALTNALSTNMNLQYTINKISSNPGIDEIYCHVTESQ
ncbi:hypothetical protein BN59_03794 [Legionella massiliensis]|uniref:Uncharacterized protein n=2 Tax=Legionella massiliensis TaxID=1034943 RepID=A0A078L2S8_9GAMM|nr:hypothetical protein BN59_03794 [Legionella massiliensis]CEE15214.1 hypothetical protein BN1094_03794 [Legionella massiliensis]